MFVWWEVPLDMLLIFGCVIVKGCFIFDRENVYCHSLWCVCCHMGWVGAVCCMGFGVDVGDACYVLGVYVGFV